MFRKVVKRDKLLLINVIVFGYFLMANRENGSKSINKQQVYKVFGTRFWDGAKRCFTIAFPRFPETGKPHLVLLINVMIF